MPGEVSLLSTFRRHVIRLSPPLRSAMIQKALARSLKKLPAEELLEANRLLGERLVPHPKEIIDLIARYTIPKRTPIVFFDPHPELMPAAFLKFQQVHIVETNDAVRKVDMWMLYHLGLYDVTCSGRYPERGKYETIYVGNPSNKSSIPFPYVPSGALLIFLNRPELKFASMTNSGFSLVYPNDTNSLDNKDVKLCILKKN